MILMRGKVVVISMVVMFCAFSSMAEISDEEIQKAKTSGLEIAEKEIREAAEKELPGMDRASLTMVDATHALNQMQREVEIKRHVLRLERLAGLSQENFTKDEINAMKEKLTHFSTLRDGGVKTFARAYSNEEWSGPEDVIEVIRRLTNRVLTVMELRKTKQNARKLFPMIRQNLVNGVKQIESDIKTKLEYIGTLRKHYYKLKEAEATWQQHTQSADALYQFLKTVLPTTAP